MKLAEKLVYLRKQHGLSQLKLAEMMDISRQAVSRWEAGSALPSTENLKNLSERYGVPVDYLLNDSLDFPERVEGTEERTVAPQPQGKKHNTKKNIIIVICIIAMVIAGIVLYGNIGYQNTDFLAFSNMESENWGSAEMDSFSVTW